MPFYVYTCDSCGADTERFFQIEHRRSSIKCPACGGKAARNIGAEARGVSSNPEVYKPHVCPPLGVHPAQVPEMRTFLKNKGLADHECEFKRDTGEFVVLNRQHQRKVLRARGMVNFDGGYGDN